MEKILINLLNDFIKISDEFLILGASIVFSFLTNNFLIKYIERKNEKMKFLNTETFARNFIYLNISIFLFISGLIWSPFSKQAFLLSEFSMYAFSLWITRYVDNFFQGETKFFKITIVIEILFLFQHIKIFENIYYYISNLSINLFFIHVDVISIVKLFTYVYLLYYINKAIKMIFVEKLNLHLTNHQRTIYKMLIQNAFYLTAGLMILFGLGLKTENMVMIISSIGIGLGIGIQKLFSNIVSGFIILSEQRFKIGDLIYIRAEDLSGFIRRINLRTVVVENFSKEFVIVPNEVLLNNAVKNMDMNHKKSKEKITFTVPHDTDLKKTIDKAKKITEKSQYIASSSCRVDQIDTNGFTILLQFHVNDYDNPEKDLLTLKSDLIIDLQRDLHEFGIKFGVQRIQVIND